MTNFCSTVALLLLATVQTTTAFVLPTKNHASTQLDAVTTLEPKTYKSDKRETKFDRYDIPREWDGGYKSMTVNVIEPEGPTSSVLFFMHGFSQYPEAYAGSLGRISETMGATIVAVETGLSSDQVAHDLCQGIKSFNFPNPQQVLQNAVSEDTLQCMMMAKSGTEGPFRKMKGKKFALFGHSMGGGLMHYVATKYKNETSQRIDYVGGWAPVPGYKDFAPESALQSYVPKNNILLQGTWDFIARYGLCLKPTPQKVYDEIHENDSSANDILGVIKYGTHTGFEDRLVLFRFSLVEIFVLLGFLVLANPFLFAFEVLFARVVRIFLVASQLGVSESVIEYMLTCMIQSKPMTKDGVEQFLVDDPSVASDWIKKITFETHSE